GRVVATLAAGLWLLLAPPGALERVRLGWGGPGRAPVAQAGGVTPATSVREKPAAAVAAAVPGGEPPAVSRPPAGPAAVKLVDLLSGHRLATDKASALTTLHARWYPDETPDVAIGPGCEGGRLSGLDCLARTGTWTKLRRLDLPVVIELSGPDGARHYATLIGLDKDRATLELGGRSFSFALAEIDPFWDGA